MAEDNKPTPQPQRLPQNQPGVAQPQVPQAPQNDKATQQRRAAHDAEKKAVAERPQQTGDEGQKPTPTQQENDEIRAGFRHIDDKEDDGSGPDYQVGVTVRRVEADDNGNQRRKYETR